MTWDFTVNYQTGVGYTMTLANADRNGLSDSTVSWTSPSGNNGDASPTQSFNAIQLTSTVAPMTAMGRAFSTSTLNVSDLSFSGPASVGTLVE